LPGVDVDVAEPEVGRLSTAQFRDVTLSLGDVRWLFPALTDRTEHDQVGQVLRAADRTLFDLGQRLGARPDAQIGGVPLNRLLYQRLGPEPDFPVTILVSEGGSEEIWVEILCTPAGSGPYLRPGPPWQTTATILLGCDSDPSNCAGHSIDVWASRPVESPLAASSAVMAATEWLRQRLSSVTAESLRSQDPQLGHPPAPPHRD
jgi:hypothetical protein